MGYELKIFGLTKISNQKYLIKSSENEQNHEIEVYEILIKIGARNYFVENS